MYFHIPNHTKIDLKEKPLGRGGEGNVYEITAPLAYQGMVAKVYHPKERTKSRELKINYMIENGPPSQNDLTLIWVKEILYADGKFVGFLMPKAPGIYDLTSLCNLRPPKQFNAQLQKRFSRTNRQGLLNRLELCLQIAKAIHTLHQSKKYILADIKPENIKVTEEGQISIIDLDSTEIVEQNQLLFPAEKLSSEYAPAEKQHLNTKEEIIDESWDRFSMAIVFYKILLGLHPFTATGHKPYESLTSLDQKIQAGLFVHGQKSHQLKVIPKPHQNFRGLPKIVQDAFKKCFDKGMQNPELRPSAQDWINTLEQAIQAFPNSQEWRHYQSKIYDPPKPKRYTEKKEQEPHLIPKNSGGYLGSVFYLFIILLFFYIGNISNFTGPVNSFKETITIPLSPGFEKLYRFKEDGKYGFVDIYNEVIIPVQYDYAWDFKNGLAKVVLNGRWGFINGQNQAQIPIQYAKLGDFEEGLALAKLGGKYGYINNRNEIVIPFQFEEAHEFSLGRAAVKINNHYGYIDKQGRMVIPNIFQKAYNFYEGVALVTLLNYSFYIDRYGECILNCP